jgi:peptide/nickel transport system ATP-binding protein
VEYQLLACTEIEPDLIEVNPGHSVRCWLYQDTPNHRAPLAHGGKK